MSILQTQDDHHDTLVREIFRKTENGILTWAQVGSTMFGASQKAGDVAWDFYVTRNQVGTISYQYILDVLKDKEVYVSIIDGPIISSSVLKDLYYLTELRSLQLDAKIQEAIDFVKKL